MSKYGLGRLSPKFDPLDWKLGNFEPKDYRKKAQNIVDIDWDFPLPTLHQGDTPHCVGFSGAGFGINDPVNDLYNNDIAHTFYYMCKEIDGEPDAENGSYVRSMAKVLKNIGRIDAYAFAFSMDEINWWLMNRGPVIMGTIWTQEMFEPKPDYTLSIGGSIEGGHAYLVNEIRHIYDRPHYGIKNSWGDDWGMNGKAYIAISDFEKLFRYSGEAMTAVELPLNSTGEVEQGSGCLGSLINLIFKN